MSEKTTSERMRDRRRLVRREQDYAYDDRPYQRRTLVGFHDRIDEAAELAADLGPKVDPSEHQDWHPKNPYVFGDVVGAEKLDQIIRLKEILDDIDRAIPQIEGWCVLKVYAERGGTLGFDRPRVWIAATTREQAEEFAPAIEKHFASKYGSTNPDRFVVAWAAADASAFVRPGLTATEYVKGLG